MGNRGNAVTLLIGAPCPSIYNDRWGPPIVVDKYEFIGGWTLQLNPVHSANDQTP